MQFIFATKTQGQELMGTADEYTSALNAHNLEWTSKTKTHEEYLQKCRDSVLDWTDEEKEKNSQVIEYFQKRLQGLDLAHIELEVILVKTNGEECSHLPYTRKNFIVFPTATLKKEEGTTSILNHFSLGLLVHETFHILSRKNPEIRSALYEMVGFTYPVNFNQPQYTPPKFIVNPDAVHLDCVIEVEHQKEEFLATPVFEGFGRGLKLLIFNKEGKFLRWVKARKTNYFQKIKAVSGYTIHPEEILAELFRVSITTSKKDPEGSLTEDQILCQNFLSILRAYFSSSTT